ncbi:MAG: hypothetical protein JW776_04420 [Candidatus Lokiarchaeota archaeon]|nr:hypothetical protein [Candidatus Lokiarchaeota archaeon]
MKKLHSYFIIFLWCLPLSGISTNIRTVSASDGQFIDHIFLFEPPITFHSFNLTLEKNQKYEFLCELHSPNVEMDLVLSLRGPDGDGDGFSDHFVLGAGELDSSTLSVTSIFGCSISGNFILTVMGNVTENVNMRIAIYDRGSSYSRNFIVYDVSGYYDTKMREYWFHLEDDTEYSVVACRTNSIPGNETILEKLFGEAQEAFVTVILYDKYNRAYNLIRNVELNNVYGTESTSATFGVSFKAEYRITVDISSTIETVNLMFLLTKGNVIGDGPEEDPVEPPTNTSGDPTPQITLSVPNWTFGVVFAVGMVFVVIAVSISRQRTMKKIIH